MSIGQPTPLESADKPLFHPRLGNDVASLAEASLRGDLIARERLFDLFAGRVVRILTRLLGCDDEIPDLASEVLLNAARDLHTLKDPASCERWLTAIAIYRARNWIRSRQRRRWLSFFAEGREPELHAPVADSDVREAMQALYAILERMKADERIPFALRFVEGMDLRQAAELCGVSLATLKRRLKRAEERFLGEARSDPRLTRWLEGGTTWANR